MTISTDSYIIGSSPTPNNNFLLDTDGAGGLRIRRRADGSGGLLATFDAAGNLQLGSATNANAGRMVLATAQNTTSGTAIDFTDIPSWAKRITLMFNGVSTNGTSNLAVRLGASGGVESTGYLGAGGLIVNAGTGPATNSTTDFRITNDSALNFISGSIVISNHSGNTWVASGLIAGSDAPYIRLIAGTKTLAGTLDRLRLTTVNGTDPFDGGSVNILYEG